MNKRVYDITIGLGWLMVTGGVSIFDYRVAIIVGGALAIGLSVLAALKL